jgi:hypothetical protein
MGIFLSKRELALTEPAEKLDFKSPVPTRMVSNGEFNPLPQTRRQRQFEERLKDLSEASARKLGMDRRQFLRTSCGMAAAFVALNDVFGPIFDVCPPKRPSLKPPPSGQTGLPDSSSSTIRFISCGTTTESRTFSVSPNMPGSMEPCAAEGSARDIARSVQV